MNDLERYFTENTGRPIRKWQHYFEIYDRHFSRFRGTDVHVVEVGIDQGGSLQMWKEYFGPEAKIFGIDIDPVCKDFEEEQVEIFIGDQSDRSFLRSLTESIPRFDILIDDGGHRMDQQINTFEELFPYVEDNGVYLCEDLHTSYWPHWGGGYKEPGSFIEYSKNFIDYINGWHASQPARFSSSGAATPVKLGVTEFTKTAHSLHYYDSILAIEKRPIERPSPIKSGTLTD